jgi:SAM-dependent methyltransferase
MVEQLKNIFTINSSRKYLASFAERAAASLPKGARVLDAGVGDGPYRSVFDQTRYESTDICVLEKIYGNISFISDLRNLPILDDCYDLVFCSQTLEHVPEPQKVINELWRVLKPGGKLWLTAPFFFAEHEIPYDYFRYTQFGLIRLFQKSGFTIQSIEWLEGYFGTLAYQLREAAKSLPIRPSDLGPGIFSWLAIGIVGLSKLLFGTLTPFFTWLDMRFKYVTRGQCKNYAIIGVKVAPLK